MFRAARVFVIAIIVAVSLLGSASVASADPIVVGVPFTAPQPAQLFDITWE